MEMPVQRFLDRQLQEATRFASGSDLVEIEPIGLPPVQRYLVRLRTRGLVKTAGGAVEQVEGCTFAVWFPNDYTRRVSPYETVQWLAPRHAFHPNIGPGPGGETYICVGRIAPGTTLVDLVEQVHEIFGWVNRLPEEREAMNHDACQWARSHADELPIDTRPLRRNVALFDLSDLEVEEVASP